eukprot:CAMPEP_0183763108 /NCGR_PEP_ID=MMETSP0739-20130205/9477_1 /TAXON_ID=385413 /ORGANISM="Thalassiosira miniscula, Strain CCMP1093" /LENGTH=356 /DNA_ID=CAMNT_0026001465 /DNA_START=10 /DNA_END=1081 /DNA_ORIENTATION=+
MALHHSLHESQAVINDWPSTVINKERSVMDPTATATSSATPVTAAAGSTTSFSETPNHCTQSTFFSSSSSSIEPRKDALASSDGVVGVPIDFDTASSIEGKESQIVTIRLEPDQVLRAESGAMMYMTDGVSMNTTTGGGLSAGFQRMLTGQNVFISDYTYDGSSGPFGYVALGTDFPSKIIRLSLEEYGGKIVCQKGALLCASHTVDITMEFTKSFGSGFFGGEGFVLQGLSGTGDVMVKAGGALIRRDLREGEVLRISSGCLVGFQAGVEYDIPMVPGFKNVVFGGEGLFMTTLTGPGTVWLQGQPPQRMISEIARRVPSGGGIGLAVPLPGMGGGGDGGGEGDGGDSSPGSTAG